MLTSCQKNAGQDHNIKMSNKSFENVIHLIFLEVTQIKICGRGEGCAGFWWRNLRERDHWGDPDVDGRIILRWIFRKQEGVVGTGWSWLRIGTGGRHL